jgi:outer membrane receptor protein involved in Fe transport
VRALYKFKSSSANDNLENGDVGGYGVTDFFVGARDQTANWEVSLWAKNLFNKEAEVKRFANEFTPAGGGFPALDTGYRQVSVIQDRTIGLTGKYFF